MEADDPVTVYTLNDPCQAEIIKGALRHEGISCELDGERQAGLSDILEIGVLVRARDADRARKLIRRHEVQWAKEHEAPGSG
jgi:DNA-binding GntR family transcriptional regulator